MDILNSVSSQFKKLSDLEINQKYAVNFFEVNKGNYGEQLAVNIENFKITFPLRYSKFISNIKHLNKSPMFSIYKGKITISNNRQMHDIEFID